MSSEKWSAVDEYIGELLLPADAALDSALQASAVAGLPPINVSPPQGKLLHLLAAAMRARRILEIGTLGGYSTIWLARALPLDGRLITLEVEPKHAAVAKANFDRACLGQIVELRLGDALDSLAQLALEQSEPFDLVFIDADKERIAEYFRYAIDLTRSGSVIVVDNVVRDGAVTDPHSDDAKVQGVRRFNSVLAAEDRVSATTIQTVGSKGYDGLTLALVV